MHTISSLRQTLGLTSANQVRNRIEAIKDLLVAHTRRGPNNQILLTDAGAELLRRLQELYDSGLTINEASDVLRSKLYKENITPPPVSRRFTERDTKPDRTEALLASLREQVVLLRQRVDQLERRLELSSPPPHQPAPWWTALREEIDAP